MKEVVGLAENKATQPSLAGAWAELGKKNMWRNIGIGGVALGKILGRLAFYTWVAENLASFSLQDGATKWYYNHWTSHPATQLIGCTTDTDTTHRLRNRPSCQPNFSFEFCAVSPP